MNYKLLSILLLAFLLLPLGAWAADDTRTGTAYTESVEDTVSSITEEIAPNVTTEDLANRIETKGNEVVTILQKVGKYVCICSFVICCALVLVGCIGNRRLVAGGLIGCVLSGLAYAGIICGREIVNWIAAWVIS